jgi:hypothetical protein
MALTMTEPLNPSPEIGTRLILASEEFLERIGTRTERGDRITAEWGEPDDRGWYTPIFTAHADDNLIAEATAHADAQASRALRAARFVAEHWRDETLAHQTPYMALTTHPLAMVLAAMDGETDPVHVGLNESAHEAFRRVLEGETT